MKRWKEFYDSEMDELKERVSNCIDQERITNTLLLEIVSDLKVIKWKLE